MASGLSLARCWRKAEEIYARMERKVLDVSRNIVDGGEEELFNHLWCNHVRGLLK